MPDSVKAMPDVEDHADNSAATAAAADDGLLATIDRETRDEQAHTDDAHAAGAHADDQNPDAEDATDEDGDADGTAPTLPSKYGASMLVRQSHITAGNLLYSPPIISESKAEIAELFMNFLTKHPRGIRLGKPGEGFAVSNWSKYTHYGNCKWSYVCLCCKPKKDKRACEFCVASWRLSMVSRSWKQVVDDIGHELLDPGWISWSNLIQKDKETYQDYGNHYRPDIDRWIWRSILRDRLGDRLVAPGYEPQGRARDIRQENNNRWKDADHNNDNNSDKSNNDAWMN